MNALDVLYAQLTRDVFAIAKFLLTICWYTNGHLSCFDCLLTVFDDWYTVGTVLVDL